MTSLLENFGSNHTAYVVKVALPVPLRRTFDYLVLPQQFAVPVVRGMRVKVPFGKQMKIGLVLQTSASSSYPLEQLKNIDSLCEDTPLFPLSLCEFIEKTAEYYHHPLGEVAFTSVPVSIRQGKPCEMDFSLPTADAFEVESPLTLNEAQQAAFDSIVSTKDCFNCFLLEGVTGSGKTEVYLQIAAQILQSKKQVLILVPEISLTPQTVERFQKRFGNHVASFHSRMTPAQKRKTWLKIRTHQVSIVIGTRSALFLPYENLGLIVIDEEHDPSFKQQEGFRYSARDSAVWRAKLANCPIILGSATPAFETLVNAKNGKYQPLYLPLRATNIACPTVTLLDIRHNKLEGGLSAPLLHSVKESLARNQQVLLFINRRGYAPTYMCYSCNWLAECKRCDARLTYHHLEKTLICHHCLFKMPLPKKCQQCSACDLHPVGLGTQKIEEVLQAHFKDAILARIDSDMTRKKGQLEEVLKKAQQNEVNLLIGTQILAKGHHFPKLSLVAIVDVDGGLFSADFRALERMAQLIIQVAGRAGRVHEAGQVLVQTSHPEHPLLKHILSQNYPEFSNEVLKVREQCQLPPFSHFALIRAHSKQSDLPERLLKDTAEALSKINRSTEVKVLGPIPAPMLKRQGDFRFQLLLQSSLRKPLHDVLNYCVSFLEKSKLARRVKWSLDVDPQEMM